MDRLVRLEGRTSADEVPVVHGLAIGRGEECGLRVFDETASRRHAVLVVTPSGVRIDDAGSANGTFVNGARVPSAMLRDGDEVAVGRVRLRFLSGAEAAARPTRAAPPTAAPAAAPPPPAVDEAAPRAPAEDDGTVEAAVDPAAAEPGTHGGDAAVARLRLVCRAAEVAAGAASPVALCHDIVDLLAEALQADRAAIHLGRPGSLRVVADHPRGACGPIASRTLARRVLEQGEAVLVRDAQAPEARQAHASLAGARWRSTLAAPLRTAEGTHGAVVLESAEPGRWDAEDLAVAAAVARQSALALRTLRALSTARAEARRLARPAAAGDPEILGLSSAMQRVLDAVDRAAPTDATVLLRGETGTGKELLARRIHARSTRAEGPFVAVNCAAVVEGLLESELFGHEKGAFTGAEARHEGWIAQAAGGTLFLDEVGELSPALQAKLLRVLSDRTYSRVGGTEVLPMGARLVAATHRDLPALVAQGLFRQDLWYRLAVVTLEVPPLRVRGADVDRLAEAAVERIGARLGRRAPVLSEKARERLRAHRWPGNVRELENAIERALVLCEGEVIEASDLPVEIGAPRPASGEACGAEDPLTLREAERRAVVAALARTGGRKGEAAAILGISWPTLNRKIRDFGL